MSDKLTTAFGAPVPDNQNTMTAGWAGCRTCGFWKNWPISTAR
jgi:catalase